jgi:hypothetical protein
MILIQHQIREKLRKTHAPSALVAPGREACWKSWGTGHWGIESKYWTRSKHQMRDLEFYPSWEILIQHQMRENAKKTHAPSALVAPGREARWESWGTGHWGIESKYWTRSKHKMRDFRILSKLRNLDFYPSWEILIQHQIKRFRFLSKLRDLDPTQKREKLNFYPSWIDILVFVD